MLFKDKRRPFVNNYFVTCLIGIYFFCKFVRFVCLISPHIDKKCVFFQY